MKKFLVCMIGVLLFTGCGCSKNNVTPDKKSDDVNIENIEDQTYGDITFEHFAVTQDSEGISVLYFDITNNTEKSIDIGTVTVTLYSKKALVLSIDVVINETIEAGSSRPVVENFDVDLTNVDEVKYQVS